MRARVQRCAMYLGAVLVPTILAAGFDSRQSAYAYKATFAQSR